MEINWDAYLVAIERVEEEAKRTALRMICAHGRILPTAIVAPTRDLYTGKPIRPYMARLPLDLRDPDAAGHTADELRGIVDAAGVQILAIVTGVEADTPRGPIEMAFVYMETLLGAHAVAAEITRRPSGAVDVSEWREAPGSVKGMLTGFIEPIPLEAQS